MKSVIIPIGGGMAQKVFWGAERRQGLSRNWRRTRRGNGLDPDG